ncbi:hypothetical protein LTX14_001985 [Clostridium perfringens]|uniref:hypothetical protein n=1 Tax=Clostridium perfringens TaxID=1502 RepID=UPI0013E2A1DD|nr:hypothetical protein [Clostridium perfringens]MDK0655134.1 hypothetical protein [Clostridium perfringens]MDK0689227.1 hypothetical protein [Clostridium perfringens]MDM0506543.1 hypothetical protein [Clostridium perfringens]MDM0709772.1 hypothetical protein [Clostridium perfringens]MDM0911807.1 hypothetical protein [Clostridium perfringens]
MKDNKVKYEKSIIWILIFTLVFSFQIRTMFLNEEFAKINVVVFICLAYVIFKYIKYYKRVFIVMFLIFSIYYILTFNLYQASFLNGILAYMTIILPLSLIGLNLDKKQFEDLFKICLVLLNIIIILITVLGILDFILDYNLILNVSKYWGNRINQLIISQKNDSVYRLYSFIGHPLFNSELYLIFYILNNLYNRYFNKYYSNLLLTLIAFTGIGLTASKTGFILIIITFLIFNLSKINIKKILVIILVFFTSIKLRVFTNTLERFMNESLTTGRAEKAEVIAYYNLYPFKFFTGYGTGFTFKYSEIIPWASAAFEYPFKMYSLELGILNTLFIYFFIAIYPVYILLKRGHYILLISFLIILIDVNTFNGVCIIGDYMTIFCFYIFIIMNISNKILISRNV